MVQQSRWTKPRWTRAIARRAKDEAPAEVHTEYDITEDAVASFLDGVRTGQVENAVPAAVETMYTAIMARQAIYTRKEVTWSEVQK